MGPKATPRSPLLSRPVHHRARQWQCMLLVRVILSSLTLKSSLALIFSIALTIYQFIFLPLLVKTIPDAFGLLISFGVSTGLDLVTDGVWILITVDLDTHFHDGLVGAKLNPKQRDALRKVDSLDTTLRIFLTKLPVVVASLTLAFQQAMGIPLAIVFSFVLLAVNVLSRHLVNQDKAIEESWERTVRRNISFNTSDESRYKESQANLRRSRIRRGLNDKARAIVWAACLLVACYYASKELPVAVYGKILKDVGSLDAHMDKLSKSLIPVKTLISTYWEVQTGDGPNRDVESRADAEANSAEADEDGSRASTRDGVVM